MSSVLLPVVLGVVALILGPVVGLIVDRAEHRERPEGFLRCGHRRLVGSHDIDQMAHDELDLDPNPPCGVSLGSRSLLPLATWTRRCSRGHVQWRYVAVDVALVVLFVAAGARFGTSWQLVPYLVFFALLVAMSVIDAETKLLLNILTGPTFIFGLFAVLALSGPNNFEAGIVPALVASAAYGGFLLVTHLVNQAGMGLGDVKLAPTLGLFLGWMTADVLDAVRLVLAAAIVGMLVGGAFGLVAGRSHKAQVPLGPFIALGAVVMILATTPAALSVP